MKQCLGHANIRSQKFAWMGEMKSFITTGFAVDGRREVIMWNYDDLSKIESKIIDNGAQYLQPYFDHSVNVLFLVGKGDGNIRYFELFENKLHALSEYRDGQTAKAYFFFQKNVVDVQKCEIMRVAKLSDTTLEIVSLIQPRKGDYF